MPKVKVKIEPRTPIYLWLPTPLKHKLAQVADVKNCTEREVVVNALEMYIAYTAAQPAPAAAVPQEA